MVSGSGGGTLAVIGAFRVAPGPEHGHPSRSDVHHRASMAQVESTAVHLRRT